MGTGKHHLNLCYEIMLERGKWVDDVVCVGESFKPLETTCSKSIPKREMSVAQDLTKPLNVGPSQA